MSNKNLGVLTVLFMTIVIDGIGMGLVYPILAPLFSAKIGGLLAANISLSMRNLLYGVTLSVFPLCMFFGAPILGNLSDQVGRKKVLLICLYGVGIGFALAALAIKIASIILFIFSRAISGMFAGSFAIAQASIIDLSDENNKTTNISLITFANVLGYILGPLLGGVLADKSLIPWFGFIAPFLTAACLAFFNGTLLGFNFQETCNANPTKISFSKGIIMFTGAFTDHKLRNLTFTLLAIMIGWSVYILFTPLYLVQVLGYKVLQVGHFITGLALIMGFTLLVIIRVVLRFMRPAQVIRYALFCTAVGTFMVYFWSHIITIQWLAIIPISIGFGLAYSCMVTLFSNQVSKDRQGWVMGVVGAIVSASSFMSGLLVGAVSSVAFKVPLAITALAFTAAIIIYRLPKARQKNWRYIKNFFHNIIFAEEYSSDKMQEFFTNPDLLLDQLPEYIKNTKGDTTTVGIINVDGRKLLVKRYNIRSFAFAVKNALRRSRAMRSWLNAHKLLDLNIATAKPVAVIERRLGPVRRKAYFIAEFIDGMNVHEYFRQQLPVSDKCRQIANNIIEISHKFAEFFITHGDFRDGNFIIGKDNKVYIIDLDHLKTHCCANYFYRRACRRDLNIFMKYFCSNRDAEGLFMSLNC